MKNQTAPNLHASWPPLAEVFRSLAAGLRSGRSIDEIFDALGQVLSALPGMESMVLRAGADEMEFRSDVLTIPILGGGGVLGTLEIKPHAESGFDAGQLQVAAAVADAVSVVLEHSLSANRRASSDEVLSITLEELPVGVICFQPDGARTFANEKARSMLGGKLPTEWAEFWRELAPASRQTLGESFIRRDGEQFLQVAARGVSGQGPTAIILTDLMPKAKAFEESLACDVLRCAAERQTLSVAVVRASEGSPEALGFVESLQPLLPPGARVGPIDAESAAVAVFGMHPARLLLFVRSQHRARPTPGLCLGIAEFLDENDTAASLLGSAIAVLKDIDQAVKPDVPVAGSSMGVADVLMAELERHCMATVSSANESG